MSECENLLENEAENLHKTNEIVSSVQNPSSAIQREVYVQKSTALSRTDSETSRIEELASNFPHIDTEEQEPPSRS